MHMNVFIDADVITDWDSFHDVFAERFGFPDFYGRNMNAWIDCMTCLDEEDGMSSVSVKPGEFVVICLSNVRAFKMRCRDVYDELIECTAFVNYRRIEIGYAAILALSFHG